MSSADIAVARAVTKPQLRLSEIEMHAIIDRLERCDWNKTAAAKSLGISLKTMYNKLHKYGLFEAVRSQGQR